MNVIRRNPYGQHFKFRAGERPLFPRDSGINYERMCKGMKQAHMERGLWKTEMRLGGSDSQRCQVLGIEPKACSRVGS